MPHELVRSQVPAKEPADKNDKKAQRAEREAEKARADAERAREREKANIAAMRAQIANKGCGSTPAYMSHAAAHSVGPQRSAACFPLLAGLIGISST